jgi:hypothetical protein
MIDDDPTTDKDLRSEQLQLHMEEYKALRAEGLRSAGIIANTVWLGTAQFAITIVGAATYAQKAFSTPIMLPIFLILLSLESMAASFMFLAEFGKYVRVGHYIRVKIEKKYPVMEWEHWIQSKRSIIFPIFSITILQLPFLASTCFLYLSSDRNYDFFGWPPDTVFWVKHHLNLNQEVCHSLVFVLICIDFFPILIMSLGIKDEGNLWATHDKNK